MTDIRDEIVALAFERRRREGRRIDRQCEAVFWIAAAVLILIILAVRP